MKESGEDRLKYVVYESTLSTADAVPLPRWGRQRYEDSANRDPKPSPRGEGAPKGRIGQERYERERGDRLKCAVYGSTLSTADAVPPSPMGKAKRRRLRRIYYKIVSSGRYTAVPEHRWRGSPSPNYHALRRHCERKPLVHRFNRFYRFNGFKGFKRCSAAHQN